MERDFQKLQKRFTAHLRAPDSARAPEQYHSPACEIYRDLVFNNLEGLIRRAFPVLHSIAAKETWHRAIRTFLTEHRCQSPLFRNIARDFLDFISAVPESFPFPFVRELAYYEWLELFLELSELEEDFRNPPPIDSGDTLRLSRLAVLHEYSYPVQLISADFIPETPAPTFLVAFRNSEDRVQFMELNASTYTLLLLLTEQGLSVGPALNMVAEEIKGDPSIIIPYGTQTLNGLLHNGVLFQT